MADAKDLSTTCSQCGGDIVVPADFAERNPEGPFFCGRCQFANATA